MKVEFTDGAKKDMKRLFSRNPLYAIPRWFDDTYHEIKWGFQRMFRGFDDRAYWGLYYEVTKMIVPVLKWMRENKTGVGYIDSLPEDATFEQQLEAWYMVYDKMIEGFQIILDDDNYIPTPEEQAKIDEALRLFAKHFLRLWD